MIRHLHRIDPILISWFFVPCITIPTSLICLKFLPYLGQKAHIIIASIIFIFVMGAFAFSYATAYRHFQISSESRQLVLAPRYFALIQFLIIIQTAASFALGLIVSGPLLLSYESYVFFPHWTGLRILVYFFIYGNAVPEIIISLIVAMAKRNLISWQTFKWKCAILLPLIFLTPVLWRAFK